MDICLLSTLARLGLPSVVAWGVWILFLGATLYIAFSTGHSVDRCKAGLLIGASLLLSPYAAGNSLLAIAAIGVVPLFRSDLKSALALGILIDLPYLVVGLGWRYAFAALAIGPFLGVWAMGRLRTHPDALRLAEGRR